MIVCNFVGKEIESNQFIFRRKIFLRIINYIDKARSPFSVAHHEVLGGALFMALISGPDVHENKAPKMFFVDCIQNSSPWRRPS